MELNERIAAVRKAAGLTQEQLGERLGVTRQAVSKWESGQTAPDAATVARLCETLRVSADYVLLGREPESGATPAIDLPDTCPCCGREIPGTICPVCGFVLPAMPPRGPRYAVVATAVGGRYDSAALEKYCGYSREEALALGEQLEAYGTLTTLRRGLTDHAAQYVAAHLLSEGFHLHIVQDDGEASDEALAELPKAMELPTPAGPQRSGLGFWGVVGAVILALLILSFF
ncbi:helix-turn-helix domain-containing protein [uncultured Oscillibacter sp.]|uniref:helix-turn-helix domain-containing protein n=1 Tax=uncultured Oscillibacter sp. TaxID=876091 RepID=UPI0025DE56F5|nr:helix-turn-helix transcriptional regulator [uncultured Oscillibacter sp.]